MTKRILVVDDEKNIRLMLDQALSTAGYEVVTAIDGEQALEKAREAVLDMVLLDMKLPGMDGLEVLRRLRSMAAEVPVVMITAHGTIESAVEAMKLGAIDYLRKPFTPEEIRTVVGKVLARQQIDPEQPAETAGACVEQVKLLLSRRHFHRAEELLHRAIGMEPGNAEALNLLGVALELKGHVEEAARYYRAALSFEPGFVPAQQNLHRVTQWPYNPRGIDENLTPGQAEA